MPKTKYKQLGRPGHPMARAGKCIREHRLVAAQKLGRLLLPSEVVHHIDGDTTNNDPDNLAVLSHGEHARQHWQDGSFDARLRKNARPLLSPCPGCQEDAPHHAKGLCLKCYQRESWRQKTAKRTGRRPRRNRPSPVPGQACEECGQVLPIVGLGLCHRCYSRLKQRHYKDSSTHDRETCPWCRTSPRTTSSN